MLMFIQNGKLNISLIDVGSEAIFDTDVNIDKNHDFTNKGLLSNYQGPDNVLGSLGT